MYLQATFTFNMASNATPCENLQFDRFTANIEVLRCQKAILEGHLSRYLAIPRESQIEVTEINAINIEGKVQRN